MPAKRRYRHHPVGERAFLLKNPRVEAERLAPLWRNMDWQGTSECQPLPRRCLAERAGEGIEVAIPNHWRGERGREGERGGERRTRPTRNLEKL
jgi:hypothetical protein